MKRSSKSSKPSFPAPQGDGNLSSDRPSAKTFNKKRFWTVIAIVAVIEVLAIALVQQWRYIFPSHEVSDLYTHYEKVDGIDASFIKDFRVNDSVFIDVTLLEAKDSAGWATLMHDFAVPEPNAELQAFIDNGEDLIFSHILTPDDYPISISKDTILFDILAVSYHSHTLTLFHAKHEREVLSVFHHNNDESSNK